MLEGFGGTASLTRIQGRIAYYPCNQLNRTNYETDDVGLFIISYKSACDNTGVKPPIAPPHTLHHCTAFHFDRRNQIDDSPLP